jgi:D-serine deaminase-like pyridoxal phosphate-dependent protein
VNGPLPSSVVDLPTPALVLDLDVLDANLSRMQARADALGVRLRPHIKTHKCVEVGERQRALGAAGITVSTLEEARVFARHGFDDITWAYPLILSRIDEALELAGRIALGLTVDSERAIDALERVARPVGVWLKVDCGYGRAGVDPSSERAIRLARRLADSSTLAFRGLLTHSGHAYHAGSVERIADIAEEERAVMVALGDRLRVAGIDPRDLSVGSTPALSQVRSLEGIDEARPGNYALYDYTQVTLGSCALADCALTVLASVISTAPGGHRSITDAGALALSKDLGPPDDPPHFGCVWTALEPSELHPEARVVSVSQEHGVLNTSLPVGTKTRILPNHSCLTVAHFDAFIVVRGSEVLDSWKIWRSR